MKRTFLTIVTGILVSVSALMAASHNFPDGKYICVATSAADKHWNVIYKFSDDEMKKLLFKMDKKGDTIIDGQNDKYKYIGSRDSMDVYYNKEKNIGIILKDESLKKGDIVKVGIAYPDQRIFVGCEYFGNK